MIWVKHSSGGVSTIAFRTYEQGRQSFEGDAKDWIWDDEEPPADVYGEQRMRVLTTKGRVYITFTPLQGTSDVVKSYTEPSDEARAVKYYVQAGWRDVPHLDEGAKLEMIAGMAPHEIKARTLGEPSLGAGAIYPIGEDEVLCDTFAVPSDWMRGMGMDVGWNRTACVWAARNPANGNIVLYDEFYQGQHEPGSNAAGIRARGEWIKGVIDPASKGRSQVDGKQLLEEYRALGLILEAADNTVEAGLLAIWQALVSGRLKVMRHLQQWRREFSRYHRDEKGHIVKQDDHLMDAMRYFWMSGRDRMTLPPRPERDEDWRPRGGGSPEGWMA
jgi:phage terminase large subunit-like protein